MKRLHKDLILLILCLVILAYFWMNPVPAGGQDDSPPSLAAYYVRLPVVQAGGYRSLVPVIFKSPAGVRIRVRETGNRYIVGAAGQVVIQVALPVTLEVEAPASLACIGRLIVVDQPGVVEFCL